MKAIDAANKKLGSGRFVIRVKSGVYKENVVIGNKMSNRFLSCLETHAGNPSSYRVVGVIVLLCMAKPLLISLETLFDMRGEIKSETPNSTNPALQVLRFVKVVLSHVCSSNSVQPLVVGFRV